MTYPNLHTALVALQGDRSERQTAISLGVAPNTFGNWLSGTHTPPATRLPFLAAALGMPLADLSAMVARERARRLRRSRSAGGVVAGHAGASSCRKSATKPARRPGHKAAPVAGAVGGVKS